MLLRHPKVKGKEDERQGHDVGQRSAEVEDEMKLGQGDEKVPQGCALAQRFPNPSLQPDEWPEDQGTQNSPDNIAAEVFGQVQQLDGSSKRRGKSRDYQRPHKRSWDDSWKLQVVILQRENESEREMLLLKRGKVTDERSSLW